MVCSDVISVPINSLLMRTVLTLSGGGGGGGGAALKTENINVHCFTPAVIFTDSDSLGKKTVSAVMLLPDDKYEKRLIDVTVS